jgi:hypothetical protein
MIDFFLTQYESFYKKPFLLSEGAIFRVLGTKAGKKLLKVKTYKNAFTKKSKSL